MTAAMSGSDRSLVRIAFLVAGAIVALVLYVLYVQPPGTAFPRWTLALPTVNAGWNTLTVALVSLAVLAIRRRRVRVHVGLMIGALASGTLFLVGYVVYHHFHGDTAFPGTGWIRPVYFSILISHILSAVAALPLVLASVLFAANRRFSLHRRWARITAPVWLYTALTGLLVYVMLSGAH